jgi:hypothetical protein
MAERKSGPVKPPVIDLTAKPARPRPAAPKPVAPDPVTAGEAVLVADAAPQAMPAEAIAAPAAEAAAPAPEPKTAVASDPSAESVTEPPRSPPPRPLARLAMPWSAITIAAVAGALLGTALTYLAVNFIALPDSRPVIADPSARLEAQDKVIADLTARLAAAETAATTARSSAEQAATRAAADIDALKQQVAAIPAPTAVDLEPLQTQVASLEDRIAAIGAGASGADATALADTISGLEGGIGEVRAALDALTQRTSTAEASVAALRGEVDATKSAVAAQTSMLGSSDIGPAVRLPLMVSGVESAFANGRPFAAELTGLTTLLPDLTVPDAIRAAAPSGLPRPDAVAAEFTEKVPTILAGRMSDSSGDLTQDAIDWAKGLLALRPVEETEGTTPEAIVSRLEAAIGRRDFVGATALLDQLPEAMQVAAGDTATDIRTLAAADGFIATLRAKALEQPEAEAPAEPAATEGAAP